jgi:hypothetical protein
MLHPSRRGGNPPPSAPAPPRPPARRRVPDLSFTHHPKPAPRLDEPDDLVEDEADVWCDSRARPSRWPAWTDRVRFVPEQTFRIYPKDGPRLPLADPEGGAS